MQIKLKYFSNLKNSINILKELDFEGYLKDINDNNLSKEQSHFIKNNIKDKIEIDKIYFSGNYPSAYFKSIDEFNEKNIDDIISAQKLIWNERKVPFLYVSTQTEIKIYNCFEEPKNPKNIENKKECYVIKSCSTKDDLTELVELLGRIAIDSGTFWNDNSISENFKKTKRVDKLLVDNLKITKIRLLKIIGKGIYTKDKITSIVHNLLTRSLFILYLEDIGAIPEDFFNIIKKDAKNYFDILKDKTATYDLFSKFEKKFNGNLFIIDEVEKEIISERELEIISRCFWGGDVNSNQGQLFWTPFDFKVIPIELLSEIYEMFLKETDEEKSENGEYYTPHSLVELMLNEYLPWADDNNTQYDLKILDIACGSGIFLVESYRRLVDRWIYVNKKQPSFDDLENILLNTIFGFEINSEAIKVAAFSLYLALISYLDPKTLWLEKERLFPYLIYNNKVKEQNQQGHNLHLQSSLTNTILKQPDFDLVIGNPPFKSSKTGKLKPEIEEYCLKYGFAQEMVMPFIHRASEFCKENGKVAIVSTSKILFNKSSVYQTFRDFLFKDNYVETVFNFSTYRKIKNDIGTNLFANAVGPACVIFFKKIIPSEQNHYITYICPKPSKNNCFTADLILDALDFYYIPRSECDKSDSLIWKVAMWGTENDFHLINSLKNRKNLKFYLTKKNGWHKGVGFKFLTPTKDNQYLSNELPDIPVMEAKYIQKYFTNKNDLNYDFTSLLTEKNKEFYLNYYNVSSIEELPKINIFRGLGNIETYKEPHILVKCGQSNKQFCASFLDYNCSFKDVVYGISFNIEIIDNNSIKKVKELKSLTAFLNSKFASYYLFLTSISWGIEREKVQPNEILSLPALPFEISEEYINKLAEKVDLISFELSKEPRTDLLFTTQKPNNEYRDNQLISKLENEIDEIIYDSLNLSKRERFLIEDVLNYSLDLFQKGEKLVANKPIKENNEELIEYLKIICEDFNEFFEFSGDTVWASIQELPYSNPMRLVAIHLTNEHEAGFIITHPSSKEINELVNEIDKYSYEKFSESLYFRKVVKYYRGDVFYIIKPNKKRFWSRSQAMQDSSSILLEIANMKEE